MFYDLHIHSCLSPCAEEEMTPNNIVNMALLKELDLIAVTDHNSVRQLPAVAKVAEAMGLRMLYGAELESSEEVHVLGLYDELEKAMSLQPWLDQHLPFIPNDEHYFGKEELRDENDELIGKEERLLIISLDQDLESCIEAIHATGGKAILAHVLDRKNSVTNQLGFIPEGLAYDGLEVKDEYQRQQVCKTHPWIRDEETFWLIDSDAHRLIDMSERVNSLPHSELQKMWRKLS
ncbi:MAG: PHP domain-containing protein [Erysipelotrichaceae bacterium]|nr:PHP domain-containing protein [Erysipelotrichaceae bacterium]